MCCFLRDLGCVGCRMEMSPGEWSQLEGIQTSGSPDQATTQSLSLCQIALVPPGLEPQPQLQGVLDHPQNDSTLQPVTVHKGNGQFFGYDSSLMHCTSRTQSDNFLQLKLAQLLMKDTLVTSSPTVGEVNLCHRQIIYLYFHTCVTMFIYCDVGFGLQFMHILQFGQSLVSCFSLLQVYMLARLS